MGPFTVLGELSTRWIAWVRRQNRSLLPLLIARTAPLDLEIVGRMLLHAAFVGVAAGLFGAAFFGGLEYAQRLLLEDLAGYIPLRAHGEKFAARLTTPGPFRPWLLLILPALGGLAAGLLTRFAVEARGGGGDAVIEAFHQSGGVIRRRVLWVKALASMCTLGTGGAGGREGPTMQIGGALGSLIARLLRVSARERRILMVAGIAAGVTAVFRTPLGAALLAVEILYRDGYESDALIPSVLASVVAYSVVISIFGETTLLAHAPRFPFVPAHLPLYVLLALLIAGLAVGFVKLLRGVRSAAQALPGPTWLKPALGGLALGLLVTPMLMVAASSFGMAGGGLGLLGGGYGAIQVAITGAPWLPTGWGAVVLLLLLSLTKALASSLTIGSGGSAGDFAPSLAIGGMFGGAFGRAAQILFQDPRIDPGAFTLIGMGAFYGGIAHVPLAALVLVCELAGNYDLLVPLMLAQGVAFVALRRWTLYDAQVRTPRDSPVHRDAFVLDVLRALRVSELMVRGRPFIHFKAESPASELLARASAATWQDVFPVLDDQERIIGVISSETLRAVAGDREGESWASARDLMQAPVTIDPDDDIREATQKLVANALRELPVVDGDGRIIGFLDEAEISRAYLQAALRAEDSLAPPESQTAADGDEPPSAGQTSR
ncbi:MAG: chloride channel protein [Deltaproteobacteria bacterium]|nr:chloride channel protein [Deltaproteobacteria bacterium]